MTRKEAKHLWRKSIKDAWGNCCAYCGRPPIDPKSLTLDHVKPKSKGGEDKTSNCVPACKKCNHSKGSEDMFEWYRRQNSYSMEREYKIRCWIEYGYIENFSKVIDINQLPSSGDIYDVDSFKNAA